MNHFYSLPYEIIKHINFFVKTSYANVIILCWKRYFYYKRFIISSIHSLPKIISSIDNDFIFSVISFHTFFYFKKLYNITTGNESYINSIYRKFYLLAVSIDDYEWINGNDQYYYTYNKYYCISISLKFKWNYIFNMLQ